MDFSKLNGNEKLAVYGAVASVIGPILSSMGFGFGVGFFTLLLALAMLAIIFLPQLSPDTKLPGSKGSLMLIVGGVAAVSAALAFLGSIAWIGFFGTNIVFVLGWLIGIAGGLLMGWAGWQEFQAEGGKFQLGTSTSGGAAAGTAERRDTVEPEPVERHEPVEPTAAPPYDTVEPEPAEPTDRPADPDRPTS